MNRTGQPDARRRGGDVGGAPAAPPLDPRRGVRAACGRPRGVDDDVFEQIADHTEHGTFVSRTALPSPVRWQRESPRGNRGLCGLRGSAPAGRRSPSHVRAVTEVFRTGVGSRNPPMRRKPRMGSRRGSMVAWRQHQTTRRRPPRSPWPSTCSSRPSAARRGGSGGGPAGSAPSSPTTPAGSSSSPSPTRSCAPPRRRGRCSSSGSSSTPDCPTRSPASTGPGCASPDSAPPSPLARSPPSPAGGSGPRRAG